MMKILISDTSLEKNRNIINNSMQRAGLFISREIFRNRQQRFPFLEDSSLNSFVGGAGIRKRMNTLRKKCPSNWFAHIENAIQVYGQLLSNIDSLLNPIQELLYFEPLLYNEPNDKWYKDHILHQVRVTRLLFTLIHRLERVYPDLVEYPSKFYASALIAGLFHDIGYPLTLLRTLSSRPQDTGVNIDLKFQLENNCNIKLGKIKTLLENFAITENSLQWIESKLNTYNTKAHAYLSGVWIISLRDQLRKQCRKNDLGMLDEIFEDAALTAFFHHFHETKIKPPVWISLDKYPLLVLLQLADIVQEWGRPIVVHTEDGSMGAIQKSGKHS